MIREMMRKMFLSVLLVETCRLGFSERSFCGEDIRRAIGIGESAAYVSFYALLLYNFGGKNAII